MMLWPDQLWPQDIGALVFLDGRNLLSPDGSLRIEEIRRHVASRLYAVARFRQILVVPSSRPLGDPFWMDATEIDLSEHVLAATLEPPGDEAQLLLAVERVRRVRLSRARPLWEMWFFTGLSDSRVALFLRMHHAIADGIASIATMASFLDTDPRAVTGRGEPWTTCHAPTEAELREDRNLRRRRARSELLAKLAHPVRSTRHALRALPAIREIVAGRPLPSTSLDRIVGPSRTFALVRSSLEEAKYIAHASSATVNDVFLAAITGGVRELFASRNERGGDVLRIYVPVSLHQGRGADARGNLISQMVVPLPIGLDDPAARLRQIREETATRKARHHPSLGGLPHRGLAGRFFIKLVNRQRVNVTSANIPGPQFPMYFAGARVLEVFPMTQLLGHVSLGVAAISYDGQFNVMAVADRDGYPDIETFADGVRKELRALAPPRARRPLALVGAGG